MKLVKYKCRNPAHIQAALLERILTHVVNHVQVEIFPWGRPCWSRRLQSKAIYLQNLAMLKAQSVILWNTLSWVHKIYVMKQFCISNLIYQNRKNILCWGWWNSIFKYKKKWLKNFSIDKTVSALVVWSKFVLENNGIHEDLGCHKLWWHHHMAIRVATVV